MSDRQRKAFCSISSTIEIRKVLAWSVADVLLYTHVLNVYARKQAAHRDACGPLVRDAGLRSCVSRETKQTCLEWVLTHTQIDLLVSWGSYETCCVFFECSMVGRARSQHSVPVRSVRILVVVVQLQ